MSHAHGNLLGEPPPTLLPAEPGGRRGARRRQPARRGRVPAPDGQRGLGGAGRGGARPGRSGVLSDTVEAYAYARTGYHRGLDALRRNGWKGFGPVPWSHEPNRGFLRCVIALAKAAEAIGETRRARALHPAAARLRPEPRALTDRLSACESPSVIENRDRIGNILVVTAVSRQRFARPLQRS